MTTDKDSSKRQSSESDISNRNQSQVPYENVVSQVVTKIKDEPFLFAIAVTALLIGLTVLATGTGSSNLRFMTIVIALLALVVILGYYILAVLKMRDSIGKHQKPSEVLTRREASPGITTRTGLEDEAEGSVPSSRASAINVQAPGANIGAIGNHAKVNQQINTTRNPLAGGPPTRDAEDRIAEHQRNLMRLEAKKAVYATGEEPLSLLNQIEREEREIRGIQENLARDTGNKDQLDY
jgi:hypothetical protein